MSMLMLSFDPRETSTKISSANSGADKNSLRLDKNSSSIIKWLNTETGNQNVHGLESDNIRMENMILFQ